MTMPRWPTILCGRVLRHLRNGGANFEHLQVDRVADSASLHSFADLFLAALVIFCSVSYSRNINIMVLLITRSTFHQETEMRTPILAMAIVLASFVSTQAQNPPAQSTPNNPAVNTTGRNNADHPVAGANSFTEGQAKTRIEASGFSEVSELNKDNNGVWRGKAKKDGKNVEVSLDFQGNVVAR
jgi:hypothetical protein